MLVLHPQLFQMCRARFLFSCEENRNNGSFDVNKNVDSFELVVNYTTGSRISEIQEPQCL
uniref:Uncharacterized protein n=1 Tax=Daucus carota subsp. sativus TaxID=79200 RepID=A0A161ZLI2_DAUCS